MARTPLPAEDKHRLLRQRIPDRMFEVYCCHRVIEIAHGRSKPPPNSKSEVTLSLGDRRYGIFPPKMVSFIALDAGIMMCRALMNFLGIYFRDRPRDRLESSSEPPRDSDVYITDFGLPVLLVETACEDFRGIHPPLVEAKLLTTLRTANIGIGHLTRTPAREIGLLDHVSNTCELVLALMNRHLYVPLGEQPVTFDYGRAMRYIRKVS